MWKLCQGYVPVLRLATEPWTSAVAPLALHLTERLLTNSNTLHPKSTPRGRQWRPTYPSTGVNECITTSPATKFPSSLSAYHMENLLLSVIIRKHYGSAATQYLSHVRTSSVKFCRITMDTWRLWQIPGTAITVFLCAIKPFACWSYNRAIQGFLSLGDSERVFLHSYKHLIYI